MPTSLTLRLSKGTALTFQEVDDNFTNLRASVDVDPFDKLEFRFGASLFSLSEPFPGIAQLGNSNVTFDVSSGTDNIFSLTSNPTQTTGLQKWFDSGGNVRAQLLPQGTDFADGISFQWVDPADGNSVMSIDHYTAASSSKFSQFYLQRSFTHNAILLCSDDFNGGGKRGSLVDVFAPVDASPTHQMSGSMYCDGVNTVLELITDATSLPLGWFKVTDGSVTQTGGTMMYEIATPATPADGQGRIYMKDAGAGKTGLYVLFPDGVEQQIKVEP